jgi:hypothetical protein
MIGDNADLEMNPSDVEQPWRDETPDGRAAARF